MTELSNWKFYVKIKSATKEVLEQQKPQKREKFCEIIKGNDMFKNSSFVGKKFKNISWNFKNRKFMLQVGVKVDVETERSLI